MVRFLDPETAEILQFLDPEIVKIDKKNSGSRNHRNGAISGSRNRRKGRQILYLVNHTLDSRLERESSWTHKSSTIVQCQQQQNIKNDNIFITSPLNCPDVEHARCKTP